MSHESTGISNELKLTILIHKDGPAWVAQCLEYDIAAQGPSHDECKLRFMRTLSDQISLDIMQSRAPLSQLGQAPSHYFDKSVMLKSDGPDLPVFVRVAAQPRLRARAQFLGSEASALAS